MFSLHGVLVFVHILGAVGLFAVLGIETATQGRFLRAATPGEARGWLSVLEPAGRFAGFATLVTAGSGLWLMRWWGHGAWILAAVVLVVAIGALGGAVTGRRLKRLGRLLAGETGAELSGEFRRLLGGRVLTGALRMRMALGIGILGLMTFKPGVGGAVGIAAVAAVAGLVAAGLAWVSEERGSAGEPSRASAKEGSSEGLGVVGRR